jgi:hypothetical protein
MIVLDTSGALLLKDEAHSAHPAVADLIAPGTADLLLSALVLADPRPTSIGGNAV